MPHRSYKRRSSSTAPSSAPTQRTRDQAVEALLQRGEITDRQAVKLMLGEDSRQRCHMHIRKKELGW